MMAHKKSNTSCDAIPDSRGWISWDLHIWPMRINNSPNSFSSVTSGVSPALRFSKTGGSGSGLAAVPLFRDEAPGITISQSQSRRLNVYQTNSAVHPLR